MAGIFDCNRSLDSSIIYVRHNSHRGILMACVAPISGRLIYKNIAKFL